MAKPRMDLTAFVGKLLEEQDGDVLREGIRVLSQALMETEVAGLIRLVGAILLEQDDEWAVAERRYFSAESMKPLTTPTLSTTAQEILAAIT